MIVPPVRRDLIVLAADKSIQLVIMALKGVFT